MNDSMMTKPSKKDDPFQIRNEYINISSPANTTYLKPMVGYYPATYGFENVLANQDDPAWSDSSGTLKVIDEWLGHKKVYQCEGGSCSGKLNFISQATGTIEYYQNVEDATNGFQVRLGAVSGGNQIVMNWRVYGDRFEYNNRTDFIPIGKPAFDNVWYHIRIDFETTDGNYMGLAQWTYQLYIDGYRYGPYKFMANYTPSFMQFYSSAYSTKRSWDAVGLSWDPNYLVGANLKPGLLLEYQTSLNVDWSGYSLDDQQYKTIQGNTTLPLPFLGYHSIQVFCNDSSGVQYASDIRCFFISYDISTKFAYINNLTETDYYFNATGACYLLAEVCGFDFTSLLLDSTRYNISYGTNVLPIDFGENWALHCIHLTDTDINFNTIKWMAVEPLTLMEENITVTLNNSYNSTFYAAGLISILLQLNFSYNWLSLEVDNVLINNIYNTSDYPEIDSGFLSYFQEGGPYLRFDLNMIPMEHSIKMKGNGSIDYKIMVNYDWDADLIDDVEELQKKVILEQLNPIIPNIWGFFEKKPDLYFTYNTTGLASGYFHLYIPDTHNGIRYLYISADLGEFSNIIVDDDNITLIDTIISSNRQSNLSQCTPYGILSSGFHLVYFEYSANASAQISFFIDNQEVLVFDQPALMDSDADGVKDEEERNSGRNEYNSDTDQDGLPDSLDSSPLASLLVNRTHIQQIVIPHNANRTTIISVIIQKPNPDYTSKTDRIWNPFDTTIGGLEVMIQPVLRLFGNESITRGDLCSTWKGSSSAYDSFCLVENYNASSVGDAIPDPKTPNTETLFIMPKTSIENYEYTIYYPEGHRAKNDNAIDLRFDFIWLITYYNATGSLKLLHYYPFDNNILIQAFKVQEIGDVNYILGSPDSFIENQILWALSQNPQLGAFNEFNVADDVVGYGTVDFLSVFNKTLTARNNHPRGIDDTEVFYLAGLESGYDVLNKINLKDLTNPSFEVNHSGDFESYISFYTISNVYTEGLYNLNDDELRAEEKNCYYIGWYNYTKDGMINYEQRVNILGFPIDMSLYNFQNSSILKITQAIGSEIPLTDIPFSLGMEIHDKIVFLNQTYIELKTPVVGIPTLNFNVNTDIYMRVVDTRRWDVEESKLIFYDYGYPLSRIINNSYNELKELTSIFFDHIKELTELSDYMDFDFNEMWEKNPIATKNIIYFYSFSKLIADLPDLIMTNLLKFKETSLQFEDAFSELITRVNYDNLKNVWTAFSNFITPLKSQWKILNNGRKNMDCLLHEEKYAIVGKAEKLLALYNIYKFFTSDIQTFFTELMSSQIPSWNGPKEVLEFVKRLVETVGTFAISSLSVIQSIFTFIPKEVIIQSKALTFISKWTARVIFIIGILLSVLELTCEIFNAWAIMEAYGSNSIEYASAILACFTTLVFGILFPIMIAMFFSGPAGWIAAVIFAVITWIMDWIFCKNEEQWQPPTSAPHVTFVDLNLSYPLETQKYIKMNGGLEEWDEMNLTLVLSNDGDTRIGCHYDFYSYSEEPEPRGDNWDWYEPYPDFMTNLYLDPGTNATITILVPILNPTLEWTLKIETDIDYQDNFDHNYYPLYPMDVFGVVEDYIPLNVIVLPLSMSTFYASTRAVQNIDYEKLKVKIGEAITNFQYKTASDNLDKLRFGVAEDFLGYPDGKFTPSDADGVGWDNVCNSTCTATIVSEKEGHFKVLRLEDNATDGIAFVRRTFGWIYASGTIEFWLYKESGNSDLRVQLVNPLNTTRYFCIIFGNDSNIYYNEKNFTNTLARNLFYAGAWYHVCIQFSSSGLGHFDLIINGIIIAEQVKQHVDGTWNWVGRLRFSTDVKTVVTNGTFYIDNLDWSWTPGYYVGRDRFCWNYSLDELQQYQELYNNLTTKKMRNNMRTDLNGLNINIDPLKGWGLADFCLVASGTDNAVIDCNISFSDDTNFYTDTPSFTQSLLSNVQFKIYSRDPYYLGGIYYFKIEVRLKSTGELIFFASIPFRIPFVRDLQVTSPSNMIYKQDLNKFYNANNLSTPIITPTTTVDIGNIIFIRCKAFTTKEITLNLYFNNQQIKDYLIIHRGNIDLSNRYVEIFIDEQLTFNKFSFGVNFFESEFLFVYDLTIINASIKGPDNQLFNPLNLTNNGNVVEFISFKFTGLPFSYVNKSLYPSEFAIDEAQAIILVPGNQRTCIFKIQKPDYPISNLVSRSIIGYNPITGETYCKYTDYLAINGIYISNPKNTTYYIYSEANKGLLLQYISEEPLLWTAYSLDGMENVSFSKEIFILIPLDGVHTIQVFGKTAENNPIKSDVRYFTLKSNLIKIFNPLNEIINPSTLTGFYKATCGFDSYAVGNRPDWFEYINTQGGTVKVIAAVGDHKQILELRDTSSSYRVEVAKILALNQTRGSIEYWMRIDQYLGTLNFIIDNGIYENLILQIRNWANKKLQYLNNTAWIDITDLYEDVWYHIRIDFECTSGSYQGLNQYTWFIHINQIKYGPYWFETNQSCINRIRWLTERTEWLYSFYIDAIGLSWDPNYHLGDNLNFGIPFAFEIPTHLKELKYSYDGQNPISISGNISVSIPNPPALHNITVYGTSLNGDHYENTVYYAISKLELECYPGYNVCVTSPLRFNWFQFIFSRILSKGNLTITAQTTAQNPLSNLNYHGSGLQPIGLNYYVIELNLSCSGVITVYIPYNASLIPSSERIWGLFQSNNTNWNKISCWLDSPNNLINGTFSNFSISKLVIMKIIDTTGPEISISTDPTPLKIVIGRILYFNSDPLITLNATDEFSNVTIIQYRYSDYALDPWINYTEPFIFASAHYEELYIRAIDTLGNVRKYPNGYDPVTFWIDKTPPSTTLLIQTSQYGDFDPIAPNQTEIHVTLYYYLSFSFSVKDFAPWGGQNSGILLYYQIVRKGDPVNLSAANFILYNSTPLRIDTSISDSYTIYYYSIDPFENVELIHQIALIVGASSSPIDMNLIMSILNIILNIALYGSVIYLAYYIYQRRRRKKISKKVAVKIVMPLKGGVEAQGAQAAVVGAIAESPGKAKKLGKIDYQEKLNCLASTCVNIPITPVELRIKGNQVVNLYRCPSCHRGYKTLLSLDDKDSWMPLIRKSFFNCDSCGTSNEGNWEISGGEEALKTAQTLEIFTTCKNCKRHRVKVVSKLLLEDLTRKNVTLPLESASKLQEGVEAKVEPKPAVKEGVEGSAKSAPPVKEDVEDSIKPASAEKEDVGGPAEQVPGVKHSAKKLNTRPKRKKTGVNQVSK